MKLKWLEIIKKNIYSLLIMCESIYCLLLAIPGDAWFKAIVSFHVNTITDLQILRLKEISYWEYSFSYFIIKRAFQIEHPICLVKKANNNILLNILLSIFLWEGKKDTITWNKDVEMLIVFSNVIAFPFHDQFKKRIKT